MLNTWVTTFWTEVTPDSHQEGQVWESICFTAEELHTIKCKTPNKVWFGSLLFNGDIFIYVSESYGWVIEYS